MTYRPTSVTIGDATYLPVPDGMTLADAEAALADAGAWVGVIDPAHCPDGARMMNRWTNGLGGDDLYVHRDDLPPTDPDAELVEKMARAAWETQEGGDWADVSDGMRRAGLNEARAAGVLIEDVAAEPVDAVMLILDVADEIRAFLAGEPA